VVEEAAGWLPGGQALLGMGAVGWVHSMTKVRCVESRGEGAAAGVMCVGQWGWAAAGRVWVGCGQWLAWVGALGSKPVGSWVKFCVGEELEPRDDFFHVCGTNWGAACGKWSGDSKVGDRLLVDS